MILNTMTVLLIIHGLLAVALLGAITHQALAVGKLSDLAVLTKDYLTIPVDEVGSIRSLLAVVGGRIVYAAEDYAALEETRR